MRTKSHSIPWFRPPAARCVEPKAARRRRSHLAVGENMDMIWYDMIWCQHGGYIGKIHCSWNMAKIWLTYSLNIVELLQTYCWKHQTQHENLKFPQLKQWWSLVRMIQNDQNVDSKENRSPKCRITMIERQARVMWGPILCLDQRS